MTVLNDDAGRRLAEMLARYGADVIDDPNRCEGFLRDRCPGLPLEINLLVAAARDRVPQALRDAATQGRADAAVPRLAHRLAAGHGIADPLARWAVQTWGTALALPVTSAVLPGKPVPPPGRRWPWVVALVPVGAVAVVAVAFVHRYAAPEKTSRPPAVVTPPPADDRLDAELAGQQAAREARAAELDRLRPPLQAAHDGLADQVFALDNLTRRVRTAVDKANDEDRWPVKVADLTLSHAEADALVAKLQGLLDGERQAIEHDATVLSRATVLAVQARSEAAAIADLRQVVRADGSAEARAAAGRRAKAYAAEPLPTTGDLVADPAKPVDLDAVLH